VTPLLPQRGRLERLAVDLKAGRCSAEENAAQALQRWKDQSRLGCVTWIDENAVLEAARCWDRIRLEGRDTGPLGGIPFLVKDNIDTVGFPTTAGSHTLATLRPANNAAFVDQMLSRGAIMFGKANMHEIACGGTSNNPSYGVTRNPYDLNRVPGGSSGGSGAAVAAGIVPIALGSDTAGSVRIPAAYCGVAGYRPTVRSRVSKAYSSDGLLPFSQDLDTIGPIASSVADLAFFHRALRGEAPLAEIPAASIRLGVPAQYYFEDLDPDVHNVTGEVLDKLLSAGVKLVPVDVSAYVQDAASGFATLAFDAGFRTDFAAFLAGKGLVFPEVIAALRAKDVRALAADIIASPLSTEAIRRAQGTQRDSVRKAYDALFKSNGIQALIFPTVPFSPPKIQEQGDEARTFLEINGKQLPTNYTMIRNTMVTSYIGAPGISIPAGMTRDRLPVGIEVDGSLDNDATLLAIAQTLEGVIGGIEPAMSFEH